MDVVKSTVCVEKYATAPWSPSKAVGTDETYKDTRYKAPQQIIATNCFPSVTLSPDRKVLGPVQSVWRRFGRGLCGIAPSRDSNNAILLPY